MEFTRPNSVSNPFPARRRISTSLENNRFGESPTTLLRRDALEGPNTLADHYTETDDSQGQMNHEAWLGSPPRASEGRGLWPLRANKIYHQDYRTSRRRPSIFLTVYIGLVRHFAANSFRPMNSFEPCKDCANTFKGITDIVVWRGSHESPGHCRTNRPYLFKFCRITY